MLAITCARAAGPQAEFFDIKTLSLGVALFQNKAVLTNYRPLKLVDLIRLGLATGLAIYDADSSVWGAKVRLPTHCMPLAVANAPDHCKTG